MQSDQKEAIVEQSRKQQHRTRKMRAKNQQGTITYIVQTAQDKTKPSSKDRASAQPISQEQRHIQIRLEQEKVVSMLENVSQTAKEIDYRVLDELNSAEGEQSNSLKTYLNSLEIIAHHWGMIKKEKYAHRVANHGHLDIYINEIPRSTNEGKIFSVKTFVLSCKTPYMKTKEGSKVFISKEYSNAAGKLHLSFYTLHDLVTRELQEKLESISRINNRRSIMAFFKTMFSSGQDGNFHPLFKETMLLKKFKRQLKIFELCSRNFEQTYIAMIKDLQEKTFKLNVDNNQEKSIIMKKRENKQSAHNNNKDDIIKTKIVDNQMFDLDGNVLQSLKNSFNHSIIGSVNSRLDSQFTQSIAAGNMNACGPQANGSPMNHLRKIACDDNSIKPTSSSQGPSRIKNAISPNINNRVNPHLQNTAHSNTSRNSGFRPLNSLNNIDNSNGQGFIRKQEFIGSIVSSTSSQMPCLLNQALQNIQKKTISPQIIKHNYKPLNQNSQIGLVSMMKHQNSQSNDELIVKFVDLHDDKENIHGQQNMLIASMNNFAFQTPNPHQTMIKNRLMATQTTGLSSGTPNNNFSSVAATIINRASNLQDCPMSTNAQKTKFPGDQMCSDEEGGQMDELGHINAFAENKAHYKQMLVNNKRVIKTSRNLFNNDGIGGGTSSVEITLKDQKSNLSIHQIENIYQQSQLTKQFSIDQQQQPGNTMAGISSSAIALNKLSQNVTKQNSYNYYEENSFENSSLDEDDSCNDSGADDDTSIENRNEINQSSMMRASRIESRIEQINPNDLMAYNNLIEQFNQ